MFRPAFGSCKHPKAGRNTQHNCKLGRKYANFLFMIMKMRELMSPGQGEKGENNPFAKQCRQKE